MDKEQSYQWLKFEYNEGETDSSIAAAEDQASFTDSLKNKILKEEFGSKCQLCKQHEETTDHRTSRCPIFAKNECLMRQDNICAYLHYSVHKALGIEMTEKWHTHIHTHIHTNQYVNMKMLQCYGIKGYTQKEKLQPIG